MAPGRSGRLAAVPLLAFLALWIIAVSPVGAAQVGVGVDVGNVVIDEEVPPGTVLHLPGIGVINTGDEPAIYGLGVAHMDGQKELRPAPSWFSFSPSSFPLDPGAGRRVEVTVNVPVDVEPGEYFALVEAFPKSSGGTVGVGIAAATRLRFTVSPGGLLSGLYHRAKGWARDAMPWSAAVPGALLLAGAAFLVTRRFRFSLQLTRRGKEQG